ncbi:hypothetical protein Q3G72_019981 [Acer saccharum]|nr:hypothetical protein Q3G72_019981 [Acer saccharum]
MHEGSNVYNIASLSDHGTKIVKGKLAEALRLLKQDMETINLLESLKTVNVPPVGDILNTAPIFNPPIAKTKGQTNARLKSNLEKCKRKATKGKHKENSHCFGPSHQSASSQLGTLTPSCSHSGPPVLSVPLGSSDFYFTRLLHGNNLLPHFSRDSSQSQAMNSSFGQWPHTFGQWPHSSQGSDFGSRQV